MYNLNINKLWLLSLLLFSSVPGLASTSCLSFFAVHPFTETVLKVNSSLLLEPQIIQRQIEKLSPAELARAKENALGISELATQIKVHNPNIDLVKLEGYAKDLSASGFLLSPLHETFYLEALKMNPQYVSIKGDHYKQVEPIKKVDLEKYNSVFLSAEPADLQLRQEVAETMFRDMDLAFSLQVPSSPKDWDDQAIKSWHDKPSVGKMRLLESKNVLGVVDKRGAKDRLPFVEALSKIAKQPNGPEYIKKILELSMNEVQSVAYARARGKTGSLLRWTPIIAGIGLSQAAMFMAAGNDLSNLMYHYRYSDNQMLGVFVSTVGASLSSWALPKTEWMRKIPSIPGNVHAKMKRQGVKKDLETKIQDRARSEESADPAEITDSQMAIIEKNQDTAFQTIAIELGRGLSSDLIDLTTWGTGFKMGSVNISTRVELMRERFLKIQTDLKKHAFNREETTSLQERLQIVSYGEGQQRRIMALLADLQSLKADIIILSYSLDLYIADVRKVVEQKKFSPSIEDLYQRKSNSFAVAQKVLEGSALNLASLERRLVGEYTTLDDVFSITQVDSFQSVKDSSK